MADSKQEAQSKGETEPKSKPRTLLLKVLLGIYVASEDMPHSASEFFDKAQKSKQKIIIWCSVSLFWLSLIVISVLSYFFLNNKNTLFNVTATSEIAEIESYKVPSSSLEKTASIKMTPFPPWMLENTMVHEDCEETLTTLSGALNIDPNTLIEFRRIDIKDLVISLVSEDSDSVGYITLNSGAKYPLSDCVGIRFEINDNTSYTFPFDGQIFIGNDIKENVSRSPILYEGVVKIADKALFSQEYYWADEKVLDIGDKFSIKNQSIQSSGFIFVNKEPGLKITYRGKGALGIISKYKSEDVVLKNSFWLKLYNDETIILLWLLLGAIYTATKVVTRFCIEHDEKTKG
ncbi:MAG: hypothetical protein ABJK64_17825 [Paraglaciecola sp.]|uniref:hypothetical protein n=1 Tax=Paraglaciecola sp. TaxID=1920173 RepID=UPI003297BBE9